MSTPPYGSLPGENTTAFLHISDGKWFRLRQTKNFNRYWAYPSLAHASAITACCITSGLTDEEIVTVLRIWHQKHAHSFDEAQFRQNTLVRVTESARPITAKFEANRYWSEVRRVQKDNKARLHTRLRVAYFLMNTPEATVNAIHEATGTPVKTVRNCLGELQRSGKVKMTRYGVYQARQGFYWDRANVVTDGIDEAVSDEEHIAMYWWDQSVNETARSKDGFWRVLVYDYCRDRFETVKLNVLPWLKTMDPAVCEWVINREGEVVQNGYGVSLISSFDGYSSEYAYTHVNGDPYDFRNGNVSRIPKPTVKAEKPDEVDYFARLSA